MSYKYTDTPNEIRHKLNIIQPNCVWPQQPMTQFCQLTPPMLTWLFYPLRGAMGSKQGTCCLHHITTPPPSSAPLLTIRIQIKKSLHVRCNILPQYCSERTAEILNLFCLAVSCFCFWRFPRQLRVFCEYLFLIIQNCDNWRVRHHCHIAAGLSAGILTGSQKLKTFVSFPADISG